MTPISKEEFMVILDRQQSSGLSIKDFCGNECKPPGECAASLVGTRPMA